MHELIDKLIERLPLDFRVLYRQFLLRVIDLEALSIQADVVGFLGQFAGVLIMLSIVHATVTYAGFVSIPDPIARHEFCLHMEHYLIATMMLVVGLFTVVSWDATFPDRRDVMVLSPLPIAPHTILFAKVTASAAVLGLLVVTLNCVSGIVVPFLLGAEYQSNWVFFRYLAAYWIGIIAASAFLYCSVLTIQGFTALLLPRRMFLRLSAFLQLAAFALFLGVYFLQPSLTTPVEMAAPPNRWLLVSSPSYWFFALFNQLNGTLPSQFTWLASRAWIALAIAVCGAGASLLLSYMRSMKKTVEEPDLVPGAGRLHWIPSFGRSLQGAIALFCIRSLTRSRQHRVAFAFYLALVFAFALSWLKSELGTGAPLPLSNGFLMSTFMMMTFAVFGLRSVFALPISLTANWVLRTTQLRPSQEYIAATRRSLLLFAVAPAWILSGALSFGFRPASHVAMHLVILGLLGWTLVELSLIGFYKVPFTCSYLPGKSNIQLVFWAFFMICLPLAAWIASVEHDALTRQLNFVSLSFAFTAVAFGLFIFNRYRARSALLYFEELPEEVITTLGLSA
jgi:hypothetical protein